MKRIIAVGAISAAMTIMIVIAAPTATATQFESPLPVPQESQAAAALVALGAERGVALSAYEPLNEVARAYAWAQAQDMRCTSDYALLTSILSQYGLNATQLYIYCIPQWVEPQHLADGLRLNEEIAQATLNPLRSYIGVGYALFDNIWRTIIVAEDATIPTAATGGDITTNRLYVPMVTR